MPANLREVISHLHRLSEPIPSPVRIYNPAKPEHICINNKKIHIRGVVRGSHIKNLSSDAVGIYSTDDRARMVIVDGLPVSNEDTQAQEFKKTAEIAQIIVNSPVGSWPNVRKAGERASITTDIYAIDNGNYLVDSIGGMDTFSFAFVPTLDGTYNRNSLKLLYANPDIQRNISTISPMTGKISKKTRNPSLFPQGTILYSATFNGLLDLAKIFGQDNHMIVTNPDILTDPEQVEPALKSFFAPIIKNIQEFGFTVLDKVVSQLALCNSTCEDATSLFALLLDQIPPIKSTFIPVGKEYRLLEDLRNPSFEKTDIPLRYHPLVLKYGLETVELLVSDILKSGLENDALYNNIYNTARSLAPTHFFSQSVKNEIKDEGMYIHPAAQYRRNKERTTPLGKIRAVVERENRNALSEKLALRWSMFGVGHQYDNELKEERPYSGEFINLLGIDIPSYLNWRKQHGLSNHGIDLMGPGLIEGQQSFDSMTAVTIKKGEEAPVHGKNFNTITGNIYSSKTWQKMYHHAQQVNGYDVLFCRPMGPFTTDIFVMPGENVAQLLDAELTMYKALLKRTYEIMSERDSVFLFTLPRFKFVGITTEEKMKHMGYARSQMEEYFEKLKKNGFDIKHGVSNFKSNNQVVYMITKNKTHPKHIPEIK